jgi:hypothetical protein
LIKDGKDKQLHASVGKLPKKDRKWWNHALRGVPIADGVLLCQRAVPYGSLRAWFAQPPLRDVDTAFRHVNIESIPVCGKDHGILVHCSTIMALHPDEATDVIVDSSAAAGAVCCRAVLVASFPDSSPINKSPTQTCRSQHILTC